MKKKTVTNFELKMAGIFHQLVGSSSKSLDEQVWWKDILLLKRLAQEELREIDNK